MPFPSLFYIFFFLPSRPPSLLTFAINFSFKKHKIMSTRKQERERKRSMKRRRRRKKSRKYYTTPDFSSLPLEWLWEREKKDINLKIWFYVVINLLCFSSSLLLSVLKMLFPLFFWLFCFISFSVFFSFFAHSFSSHSQLSLHSIPRMFRYVVFVWFCLLSDSLAWITNA